MVVDIYYVDLIFLFQIRDLKCQKMAFDYIYIYIFFFWIQPLVTKHSGAQDYVQVYAPSWSILIRTQLVKKRDSKIVDQNST